MIDMNIGRLPSLMIGKSYLSVTYTITNAKYSKFEDLKCNLKSHKSGGNLRLIESHSMFYTYFFNFMI